MGPNVRNGLSPLQPLYSSDIPSQNDYTFVFHAGTLALNALPLVLMHRYGAGHFPDAKTYIDPSAWTVVFLRNDLGPQSLSLQSDAKHHFQSSHFPIQNLKVLLLSA